MLAFQALICTHLDIEILDIILHEDLSYHLAPHVHVQMMVEKMIHYFQEGGMLRLMMLMTLLVRFVCECITRGTIMKTNNVKGDNWLVLHDFQRGNWPMH